jgi:hypothetical protein
MSDIINPATNYRKPSSSLVGDQTASQIGSKERFSPRRVAEVSGQAGMTKLSYLIAGVIRG